METLVTSARRWPAWAHPAIVILTITGGFHVYRGAPLDGVVFLAVAAGIAVLEQRSPAVPADRRPVAWSRGRWYAVLGPAVLADLVVAVAPRFGWADVMVVGSLAIVATGFAASRRDGIPRHATGPVWPYAVIGLVAALNELTAYLLQTSPSLVHSHPALSDLLDPVFAWQPGRALMTAAWLLAGIGLLRLMPQGRHAPGEQR